jgi:prepilin-type processing-associated H-X9-DG protein
MRSRVELLILVVIFLTVSGLLLSGMVRIHEANLRADCSRNLQRIAAAVANFHDTYGHFPLATLPNEDLQPEKRLSWLAALAPFLGNASSFHSPHWKEAWDSPANCVWALEEVEMTNQYRCPAIKRVGRQLDEPAPTSYPGIAGTGMDAAVLPKDDPRAGFFGYERELRLADIQGRSSMLMMAAETSEVSGSWTAGGPDTVRGLEPNAALYLGVGGQLGGLHRGGANALFADGSVRFLANDMRPKEFEMMATLHRGEK